MPLTIKSAVINYKDPDTGDYVEVNAVGDTAHVTDVRVNNTSVVTDNVANIPLASTSAFGAMKLGQGLRLVNDAVMVNPPGEGTIKIGTTTAYPIVPAVQHWATFYGLSKIAGVDMASSSNAVGTYTDEAKVAIQKMLGLYEAPWELIREDTFTNATIADHIITTDANSSPFELTDFVLWFEIPVQETFSQKGNWGQIWFYYGDNAADYLATESNEYTQEANASAHGFMCMMRQEGRLVNLFANAATTSSNGAAIRWRYAKGFTGVAQTINYFNNPIAINKINIRQVQDTGHYKLVGKRKWT